jgi:outer membrane protein
MQKRVFLTLALMLSIFKLYAKEKSSHIQPLPLKIGYVNMEHILIRLPETKAMQSECATFEKQLNNQIKAGIEDFQQKRQVFEQSYEAMTEAVRNQKQLELQQLQKSINQLQLALPDKVVGKQSNLLEPVYEKIQSAIAQIAKESGYTYVLGNDIGSIPVLLYADEQHNISDRVLKKLGIDPNKEKDKKK